MRKTFSVPLIRGIQGVCSTSTMTPARPFKSMVFPRWGQRGVAVLTPPDLPLSGEEHYLPPWQSDEENALCPPDKGDNGGLLHLHLDPPPDLSNLWYSHIGGNVGLQS